MYFRKLRGRIVEKFGSIRKFANVINITAASIYNKLAAKTEFSRVDILNWSRVLEIPIDSIGEFFFTDDVEKSQQ